MSTKIGRRIFHQMTHTWHRGKNTGCWIVTKPNSCITRLTILSKLLQQFILFRMDIPYKIKWPPWTRIETGVYCNKRVIACSLNNSVHIRAKMLLSLYRKFMEITRFTLDTWNVEIIWKKDEGGTKRM